MDFDNENRIVSPDFNAADEALELSLRPKTLHDYIGQEKVKENFLYFRKIRFALQTLKRNSTMSPSCMT